MYVQRNVATSTKKKSSQKYEVLIYYINITMHYKKDKYF